MLKQNIYCPVCATWGRKKLLFQCEEGMTGIIKIHCRGCRKTVTIKLGDRAFEPDMRIDEEDSLPGVF